MLFPKRDFGFVRVDGTLAMPVFARKKDAKKYAAKCCVEWYVPVRRRRRGEKRPPQAS